MRYWEILVRALAATVALIFIVPGCHKITPFDLSELTPYTFDDECYQNIGAPPGVPIGVIAFNPRSDDGAVAGRGVGIFGRGRFTFAQTAPVETRGSEVPIRFDFEDGTTDSATVTDLDYAVELTGLALDESEITLSICRDTPGAYHLDFQQVILWNTLLEEEPEIAEEYRVVEAVEGETSPGPVAGDWDNDGRDSYGIYDPLTHTFHLKGDSDSADRTVVLTSIPAGQASFPVAGDWNDNGQDSVGVYLPALGRFHLFEDLDPGRPITPFDVGSGAAGGLFPVAGAWDDLGGDSVGVWESGTGQFRFINVNIPGAGDVTCSPGITFDGVVPLAGDWTTTGRDGVGLFHRQSGTFLLYEVDTAAGTCELIWEFTQRDAGESRYLPIAGDWDFWHQG